MSPALMDELVLQGEILFPDGWSEATIIVRDGRIEHFTDGIESVDAFSNVRKGLIFPGLLDMHTHLGDLGARGDLPPGLEETMFPGGIKHRFLENCSREDLVCSIRNSLEEIHHGATFVMDYREGGIPGRDAMKDALYDSGPRVYSMGRVMDHEDPSDLIDRADGLGIPSYREGLEGLRNLSRKMRKPFSMHTSELFREDIDSILDLDPDQLIHMVSGTQDDLAAVAESSIPVVVCPRSNFTFNIDVPLERMMSENMKLTLGTDNSISSMQDIFREMELAWMLLRNEGMFGTEAARSVFSMAVGRMMDGTGLLKFLPETTWWWEKGWPARGDPANLFLARRPTDDLWNRDPYSFAVRFLERSQLEYTGSL